MLKKLILRGLILIFAVHASAQNLVQQSTRNKEEPLLITLSKKEIYKPKEAPLALKKLLKFSNKQTFQKVSSFQDALGMVHDKYQLYYDNVKVEYAFYTAHCKNNRIISITGEKYKMKKINIKPHINSQKAFAKVIKSIGAEKYLWENEEQAKMLGYSKPKGELILLPDSFTSGLNLAYKFDIYSTKPLSRTDVYVDAMNGTVLLLNSKMQSHHDESQNHESIPSLSSNFKFNAIPELSDLEKAVGKAETKYSGTRVINTSKMKKFNQYILYDQTRGNGIVTYDFRNAVKDLTIGKIKGFLTDNDNNWTKTEYNSTADDVSTDAHWGIAQTFDYFINNHQRNGIDGMGGLLKAYVHVGNNWDNAQWDGNNMIFGDGNGLTRKPFVTLDITAHELAHGICQTTAQLVYKDESGALDEALSDIWAYCVKSYVADNDKNNPISNEIPVPITDEMIEKLGTDVVIKGTTDINTQNVCLRSMKNPRLLNDPNFNRDTNPNVIAAKGNDYWVNSYCSKSTNDSCGVHSKSGVINRWFYVLVNGSDGLTDFPTTFDEKKDKVNKMSVTDAAKLVYRTETIYLTPNSTFQSFKFWILKAATDLNFDAAKINDIKNAFKAVAIADLTPTGTTFNNVDLEAEKITATGCTLKIKNLVQNLVERNVDVYIGTAENRVLFQQNNKFFVTIKNNDTFDIKNLKPDTSYTLSLKIYDTQDFINAPFNSSLGDGIDSEIGFTKVVTFKTSVCSSVMLNDKLINIKQITFTHANSNKDVFDDSSGMITNNGYSNKRSKKVQLEINNQYKVKIIPEIVASSTLKITDLECWMWTDINNDEVFDEKESVKIELEATSTYFEAPFSLIPDDVLRNKYTVRFLVCNKLLNLSKQLLCCNIKGEGEMEDYTMEINSYMDRPSKPQNIQVSFNDPTNFATYGSIATVNWGKNKDEEKVTSYLIQSLYKIDGKVALKKQITFTNVKNPLFSQETTNLTQRELEDLKTFKKATTANFWVDLEIRVIASNSYDSEYASVQVDKYFEIENSVSNIKYEPLTKTLSWDQAPNKTELLEYIVSYRDFSSGLPETVVVVPVDKNKVVTTLNPDINSTFINLKFLIYPRYKKQSTLNKELIGHPKTFDVFLRKPYISYDNIADNFVVNNINDFDNKKELRYGILDASNNIIEEFKDFVPENGLISFKSIASKFNFNDFIYVKGKYFSHDLTIKKDISKLLEMPYINKLYKNTFMISNYKKFDLSKTVTYSIKSLKLTAFTTIVEDVVPDNGIINIAPLITNGTLLQNIQYYLEVKGMFKDREIIIKPQTTTFMILNP